MKVGIAANAVGLIFWMARRFPSVPITLPPPVARAKMLFWMPA
jgi:hypothetical protein